MSLGVSRYVQPDNVTSEPDVAGTVTPSASAAIGHAAGMGRAEKM